MHNRNISCIGQEKIFMCPSLFLAKETLESFMWISRNINYVGKKAK